MSEYIPLSFLTNVFTAKSGDTILHQSAVTEWAVAESWPEAVAAILEKATYPKPQARKTETFGWTPTLFDLSTNDRGEEGIWRRGKHAADSLGLFIADLDNQHPDRTMIRLEDVQEALEGLGLAFLLYTSFSHRPERHKVRIVAPISRRIAPDEAFEIFLWFNAAFDRQLDGSIYDPGDFIYGPPHASEVRADLDGSPIDVDAFLELSRALPEDDRTCVARRAHRDPIEPTTADLAHAAAQWSNTTVNEAVSVHNPAIFNPDWFGLLDARYLGGSRHQSVLGLLTKAWVKSKRTLTRGDLQTLQGELDAILGGHLRRTYGRATLEQDIRAVIKIVAQPNNNEPHDAKARALAANLNRLTAKQERKTSDL